MGLTGSLLNAYFICGRKFWLFAHEISADPDWELLELGRLIAEGTYRRSKKELQTEGMKIDLIHKHDGRIIVGEIKKSAKGMKAATMQLAYYLYRLKKQGVKISGELLIPKEKKRIKVELTPNLEQELEATFIKMKEIMNNDRPPPAKKIRFCTRCAYREFCWS
ncbi:MAG TPA: CRISPR-associated protein Cas4 [Candidatus Omnitrophica bacterium]|nr:CRISPR-associated protein Cas4 [Candidatus Omnitrophota bacterium]